MSEYDSRPRLTSLDDVADYRNVDPKIGTLEDFDEMMAALKAENIKVIVDIVPNHSSDEHVWFQEALKSEKGSDARERYIFRDGKFHCSPSARYPSISIASYCLVF